MICKNCGAQFAEDEQSCPYCGADNFRKSKQEHDAAVLQIKREEQELAALPKKVANKSTKLLILGVVLFIAIGLIVALIAYGVRTVMVKSEYKSDGKLAQRLETLYQNGEYEEIYEQTKQMSSQNQSLEKYTKVGALYNSYQQGCANFTSDLEYARSIKSVEVFHATHYFFDVLMCCDELEDNGFVYDEDEAVYYFRELAMTFLRDNMCLTDEEIASFYERYEANEHEYDKNKEYTYQMRSDECDAIELEVGELIYERLVETK